MLKVFGDNGSVSLFLRPKYELLMQKVAIIDYGMGNLRSVERQIGRAGAQAIITQNPVEVKSADRIILPGVGHFGAAMANLKKLGLLSVIQEEVLEQSKPILGICLGMQLMMEHSEEGDAEGLGWFKGNCKRFTFDKDSKYKVPQMGWNTLRFSPTSHSIWNGIEPNDVFYFVHSFHVHCENRSESLAETEYGLTYDSAIGRGNIIGMQYHPEKSHDQGLTLIKNFLNL